MKIFIVTKLQYLMSLKKSLGSLKNLYELKFIVYELSSQTKAYDFEYFSFSTGKNLEDFILSNFSIDEDYLFNLNVLHIYSHKLLDLLENRLFNFHNSPLPKYKGINSVNWGIFNQEIQWGITWHKINSKIDSGEIVYQKLFKIPPNTYQVDLIDYCFLIGIKAIKELLKTIINGEKFSNSDLPNSCNYFLQYPNQPKLIIRNYQDVLNIERCQPYTSIKKFRWQIKIKNISCTLISSKKFFKNRLELKKIFNIDNYKIYYAD